jgi:uncharacterized protein (TIGR00266 family)
MKTKITGTTLPVVEIGLDKGEMIIAEPGQFSWMTGDVELKTTTQTAGAKGLLGVLGRAVSGGGLFMTEFVSPSGNGMVAFAARIPGQIMQVDVPAGHSYMVHSQGFLCATQGVELSVGFQKSLGGALFGGTGFILQKLAGTCTAWIELGGEMVTYDLAAGETIQVHPGHIGMYSDTITFDLQFMKGIANALFGQGLFIAHLTGPGKVWLQTLTLPNLAHAIQPYIVTETAKDAGAAGVAGGVAGAVMKGFFGGNK